MLREERAAELPKSDLILCHRHIRLNKGDDWRRERAVDVHRLTPLAVYVVVALVRLAERKAKLLRGICEARLLGS